MDSYASDIPLAVAIAAHNGTSHVPEERGAGEVAEYAKTLAGDYERLLTYARTDEKRLKAAGFRWAPSLGCWQAYRNHATLTTARREAGL
jgi:hypothetical protein